MGCVWRLLCSGNLEVTRQLISGNVFPLSFCLAWRCPQHWRLQAFRWGLGLVPKYQVLGRGPTGCKFSSTFSPAVFEVPRMATSTPASPEDTPKIRSGFDPGYPVTAFALGPYAPTTCVQFLRVKSLFLLNPVGAFAVKLHWPAKPNILGSLPPNVVTPMLGGLMWGLHSHSCRRMSVI